jgi:hypothetical protein
MRILLATAVAIAPLLAATGAMAEVVITTVRTTPITTSNAGGTGVADDIRISGSGGITVVTGTAVIVNSNHDFTMEGTSSITMSPMLVDMATFCANTAEQAPARATVTATMRAMD